MYTHKVENSIPKLIFILMPFLAWLLSLLFYKNKYFFVDHFIVSLHLHTMVFVLLTLSKFLDKINETFLQINYISTIAGYIFSLGIPVYMFLSLKKVYQNIVWKTATKQLFLTSVYALAAVILFFIDLAILFILV